jgi:hypothetical protein
MSGQYITPESINDTGRALCPACRKTYKPTGDGLYRYHMRVKTAN